MPTVSPDAPRSRAGYMDAERRGRSATITAARENPK